MNKLINLFYIFFILFLFEFISYFFFKLNLLEISHKPKIYLSKGEVPNDEWWTEENIWGAWHIKNGKTSQKRSCYDAIYISNEIGARDTSFSKNSTNDVVLIGYTAGCVNQCSKSNNNFGNYLRLPNHQQYCCTWSVAGVPAE